MNYLENYTAVNLLTWETNPNKRNINNEVTFISRKEIKINVGDVVFSPPTGSTVSAYEITEIKAKRKAAMSGNNHYTVATKWSRMSLLDIFNSPNKMISNNTQNAAIKLQEAVA